MILRSIWFMFFICLFLFVLSVFLSSLCGCRWCRRSPNRRDPNEDDENYRVDTKRRRRRGNEQEKRTHTNNNQHTHHTYTWALHSHPTHRHLFSPLCLPLSWLCDALSRRPLDFFLSLLPVDWRRAADAARQWHVADADGNRNNNAGTRRRQ